MKICEDIGCSNNDFGRCLVEFGGGEVSLCVDEDGRTFCSGYVVISEGVDLEDFEGTLGELFDKI